MTFGISWLIYPFFATQIIRTHYLRRGWTELSEQQQELYVQGAVPAQSNDIVDDWLKKLHAQKLIKVTTGRYSEVVIA